MGGRASLQAGSEPTSSYRTVLALDAGTVETQGGDSVDGPLDAEDTLVAALAGLRLWQVSSLKGDWLYLPDWYQDLLCGHQLGTILGEKEERLHLSWLTSSFPSEPGQRTGPRCRLTPLASAWAARQKDAAHLGGEGVSRENEIYLLALQAFILSTIPQVVLDLVYVFPFRN